MTRKRVAIVTTVLNEADNCRVLLDSLPDQTRQPDEVIVVDGGSTDGTLDVIQRAAAVDSRIKLVRAPGANIGQGRNAGIAHADGDVIASTDTGCRVDRDWLDRLVAPFEDERDADFVAGFYKIDPHSLLERVIGLATMRGALEPVNPDTFNPSARSMAFTKALWARPGRIPDFLDIDDTLFDHKIRSMGVKWVFAGDAVVHWRPRRNLRALYRQFHFYGCGGGHTQIFSGSSLYNLRNILLIGVATIAGIRQPWMLALAAMLICYFYGYAHHGKSARIARRIGDWRAYFLSLAVHATITLGDTTGYLQGSLQRWFDPKRYRDGMRRYLSIGMDRTPSVDG